MLKLPLEYDITLYSSLNERFISFRHGGDEGFTEKSKQLTDIYDKFAGENSFYAVRKITPINKTQESWLISFFTTINKNDFLVVDILAEELSNYISDQNNQIYLVKSNDEIVLDVSGSTINKNLSSVLSDKDFLTAISNSDSGSSQALFSGMPVTVLWAQSAIPDTKLLTFISSDEYHYSLESLQQQLIVFFLFVFILATIITYFVSNRLYKPVREMLKIVEDPQSFEKKQIQNDEINSLLMTIVDSLLKNNILEEDMVRNMILLDNAHIRVLQKQITPHFLHNVLQAISWMSVAETGNEKSKTSESIILLSEIVRVYMQQSDILITLKDELDYIKKYTKIEELRFSDNISYHYDIDKSLLDCKIPRLSIQPILENAINHGIKPKTNSSGNIYILK